jgi:hypothetical protein
VSATSVQEDQTKAKGIRIQLVKTCSPNRVENCAIVVSVRVHTYHIKHPKSWEPTYCGSLNTPKMTLNRTVLDFTLIENWNQ